MRAFIRKFFLGTIALLLLFEEWGWEQLSALLARLGRLPVFAWLERHIRELPPYAALALFFVPALLLIPVKLAALYFIAHGQSGFGIAVLLGAKVVGTAVVARLFALTQPTLMRLAWFARWYPRWKAWKDRVMDEVRRSAVWRAATRARAAVASRWAQLRKNLS